MMKLKNIFISLLIVLFFVGTSFGASVIVSPKFTASDSTGAPLSGGLLYTYSCGTTTPKTTYTTYTGGTANANPVVLDTRGEGAVYASGCLKLVLKDSAETTIWTVDNIYSFDNSVIQDADRDTIIQVEESADEDTIRFDVGGTQKMYIDSDGVHIGTTVTTESYGQLVRPRFTYKDGDEIYISAGAYQHVGTSTQYVYWNSTITFMGESDGSNSDNDDFDGTAYYYLYLDDSAIVTQASALLDADCFLLVTDEPEWVASKFGWYGTGTGTATSSDRCIFAVPEISISGDLQPWRHGGGSYVHTYTSTTALSSTNVQTAGSTVTLTTADVPSFARTFNASGTMEVKSADAIVDMTWYDVGGSSSHRLVSFERIGTDQMTSFGDVLIALDEDLKFVVKSDRDGADLVVIMVEGWYLPEGM